MSEHATETVEVFRGYIAYDDGSMSPIERWVRASDERWISIDSTRVTHGDLMLDVDSGTCRCGWDKAHGPTCPDCRLPTVPNCAQCGGSQVVEVGLPDIYRPFPTCVTPPGAPS